jgi:hypothetical protein
MNTLLNAIGVLTFSVVVCGGLYMFVRHIGEEILKREHDEKTKSAH